MKYKAYSDLVNIIPKDELNRKLRSDYCEIDVTMLCFEENYIPIANNVPKEFTIVDCGCYMAAQSYLFKDFSRYIGVDSYDKSGSLSWYIPPERFTSENTTHLSLSIKDFLKSDNFKALDLDTTYFICSAVPAFEETSELFDNTKNCAVFYPGRETLIKGICEEAIIKEREEIIKELKYFEEDRKR